MAEALTVVTSIALMLAVGTLVSYGCRRLGFPETLFLILSGAVLAVVIARTPLSIDFPPLFLAVLGIIAVAITVFDASSGLTLREFDTASGRAMRLVVAFTVLVLTLFSAAAWWITGMPILLAVLFAALTSGTSPDVVLPALARVKSVLGEVVKLESILNTPLSVLLPLLVIDIGNKVKVDVVAELAAQVGPLLGQLVTGIGTGIFVGILLLRVIRRRVPDEYAPLATLVGTLVCYVLAENLGGSGVLAVTALGLFFGKVMPRERRALIGLETLLARVLYILVFVLVGFVIRLPFDGRFWLNVVVLLAIYFILRYLAFAIVLRGECSARERWFGALNAAKGIPTVTVVFTLAVYSVPGSAYFVPGITVVLDYVLAFVIATILIAGFTTWNAGWFLGRARAA